LKIDFGCSVCTQSIAVTYEQGYYIRFPHDVVTLVQYNPEQIYGEPAYYGEDCELLNHTYTDAVLNTSTD